jgi:hypothetical protein
LSRYDVIQKELTGLRRKQAVSSIMPAAAVVLVLAMDALSGRPPVAVLAIIVVAIPVAALLVHYVWKAIVPTYRQWAVRTAEIEREIVTLRARIATLFGRYRERAKGEAFKKAYGLVGKSVAELEEALAVGMYRERREVFVTAFVRAGVAVRVTASIGSPYRCAAADTPARWPDHVDRLGCDEIRQYHNHPVHNGSTRPSPTDFRTSGSLRRLLGERKSRLRSLIICWNGLREWKVFEYEDDRRCWLSHEFDAAA